MSFFVSTIDGALDHISEKQIYRYMRTSAFSADEHLQKLVDVVRAQFLERVQCKACYGIVPLKIDGTHVDLSVFSVDSAHLARNLQNCEYAVIFAATLGLAVEQQRRRAVAVSSVEALTVDAVGSAGIEAFCDQICIRLAKQFPEYKLRPRFSPGYGDFPLEVQKKLLQVLDAHRKIGVSLSDGLLMIPQKSVTAVVGLSKEGCNLPVADCEHCDHLTCEFRL